jgi:hypothetical protein
LLNRIEALDGGDKFFSGDLGVSVEIDKVDPFPDLEGRFLRQQLLEALLQLELAYPWFAVGLTFLKNGDGIDLPISQNDTKLLHSFFKLLVLDLSFILLLYILHSLQIHLMSDLAVERWIPHLQKSHALVHIQLQFFELHKHLFHWARIHYLVEEV